MDDEKLKLQIGRNIAAYRKQAGLTQAGLAEKLNYSDKAVSKWERGESIPDVLTIMQLAELFGITVNDLLSDPNALPGNPGKLEKAMTQVSEKALKRKADKRIILHLSSILVWFVALLLYVLLWDKKICWRLKNLLHIDKIQIGDIVTITNLWEELEYTVVSTKIISPYDLDAVKIQEGKEMITLLSCHPVASGGKQRYLVFCERIY